MTATLLIEDLATRLQSAVATWCGAETAMISLAGEVDRSRRGAAEGAPSAGDWLAARYKLSPSRCREWVDAARRLDDHPAVEEALERGQLTSAQAAPLLQRLEATGAPSDDKSVTAAASASVPALVREARRATEVSREEALFRHRQRSLTLTHNPSAGMWRIHGALADADGAAIDAALRRKAEQMPPHPDTGAREPWDVRMADALREVCGMSLSVDKGTDRATVVVHLREDRAAELHCGATLASDTFSRMVCDSRIQVLIEKANGSPVRAASVARTVPEWLRRSVEDRDQGCTFPSCRRTRTLLHCHHIVHREHGGRTIYENLTTLCHTHHHLVHEGGWTIRRSEAGELVFHRRRDTDSSGASPPTWEQARQIIRDAVEATRGRQPQLRRAGLPCRNPRRERPRPRRGRAGCGRRRAGSRPS